MMSVAVVLVLLLASGPYAEAHIARVFPVPKVLRPNVAFWKRIFAELDSRSGLLHDSDDVAIVYQVIRQLPKDARTRRRVLDRYRRRYSGILRKLARQQHDNLSRSERRVLKLFKGKAAPARLRQAADNVRFQLGLRDRFRGGLIRSGRYMSAIRKIFTAAGLPAELGLLPHVESSFNNRAYSKYGAAGMWQFTRGTGRRFLRINSTLDERFDYRRASAAAAKLLRQNYQELGTWPLAITAYNHGVHGMKRAVAALGTRDFGTVVRRHSSPSFQFASRNFYAEFLAVVDLVTHYRKHFPRVRLERPESYHTLRVDWYVDHKTVSRYLRIPPEDLARWNPSLRRTVWRSQRLIPKGYHLRVPTRRLSLSDLRARWSRIPARETYAQQRRDKRYRVRRGDTLSTIARRYRTTIGALADLNQIDRPYLIRIGQVLKLPGVVPRRHRVARKQPPAQARSGPSAGARPVQKAVSKKPASPAAAPASATLLPEHVLPERAVAEDDLDLPALEAWLPVKGKTIRVVATETLGLYAEWLKVPARRLRQLNHLHRRQPLRIGMKLRLDFSRVSEAHFTKQRFQHHRHIETQFFQSYSVDGVITHTLKRGETLWRLAFQEYDVPLWLLQKYNHDLEFRTLRPGTKLRVPQVVEKAS